MKTWLIVDVHYLCHRAFHTSRDLSWKGKATGVIYGFLQSIAYFKDEFQTDSVAFCFEHPRLYRKIIYPAYKARRHSTDRTESEVKAMSSLAIQIGDLRKQYLPRIGFKNIFCVPGMESDDVMAAIAANTPSNEDVILITADHDLFQCLKSNVMMYSPQAKKMFTERNFTQLYGIRPSQWAVVKALSGCHSDQVMGVKGIGEVTALKYLRGELDKKSKAYQLIRSAEAKAIVRRNRALVQLPYKGCAAPTLVEDKVDPEGWKEVCSQLGMRSLVGHVPVLQRKRKGMIA